MVDAQAIQFVLAYQLEQQPVRGFEYLRILHSQGGEVVYIEESPIVDVIGGHAPVRQPVALQLEQLVQAIKARRIRCVA